MKILSAATTRFANQTLQCKAFTFQGPRPFSTSHRLSVYFPPPFAPTAFPELDTLLELIRRKVLLPRHIHGDNRKLVSDPERSKTLLEEDIRLKIGDQEERLEPHDFGKDGVSSYTTLKDARELSHKLRDFSFWQSLLRGLHGAQLRLKPDAREKLMKHACARGQVSLVLHWLDQADQLKFYPPINSIFLIAHAIRYQALFAEKLINILDNVPDLSQEVRDSILQAINQGESLNDLVKSTPGVGNAIAEALQQGLKLAIRFNLILAKPDMQHFLASQGDPKEAEEELVIKKYKGSTRRRTTTEPPPPHFGVYDGKFTVNDPILAAIPLEMQSKLEALLSVDPNALRRSAKKNSALPPPATVSAAEYATRLLYALEQEPISQATIPPLSEGLSGRQKIIVREDRINWILRALAVTSSLRAASSVIKNDTALLERVNAAASDISACIDESLPTMLEFDRASHNTDWLEACNNRLQQGKDFGRFGDRRPVDAKGNEHELKDDDFKVPSFEV